MLKTLVSGAGPVCTAGPPTPVMETRPGAYRLTPIPGPVNRNCQATTTAVAARNTVTRTWRSRRVPGLVSMTWYDRGLCCVRLRRWRPSAITA